MLVRETLGGLDTFAFQQLNAQPHPAVLVARFYLDGAGISPK